MKLSEMILDEKIKGTLDQGRNCLIVFEEEEPTDMFDHAISTFNNLDQVLDSLYDKTQKFKEKYYKWCKYSLKNLDVPPLMQIPTQ